MLPKLKLQILHKGLLLLLIPFSLQMVLFFQLFSLESKAEQLSAEVDRLAVKQTVMSSLAGALVDVIHKMILMSTGRVLPEENTVASMERLQVRFAAAKKLLVSSGFRREYDLRLMHLIDAVQKDQMDMLSLLQRYQKDKSANPEQSIESIATLGEVKSRWLKFSRYMFILRRMLDDQVPVLQRQISENQANREKIKPQLYFGIASEIVLTFFLLLVFLKDITGRLQVLVRNAYQIPSGKPLSAKVSGTDELAYLDTVLHSASSQLREATEYRKSLMQMVAHDLRSPLISIRLALDLILTQQDESTRASRVVSINRNVGRLILLIEDLLTIEKLESGKLELNFDAVNLAKVIDEASETLGSQAQAKTISLKNEVDGTILAADPDRLLQVITNLVSNAIKYSKKNTSIVASAERKADAVTVSITDEGQGISAQKQAKLFEKFYRTNPGAAEEGFGLGLAICKLIVDAHGGKIGVTSSEGKGSTFWFTIPRETDF